MPKRLPAVGRVFAYWRAERRTIRQGFVALWISSLGDLISGLTLGAITHTLQLLPGLIVLVPAAIGMRGNIFGALGSRLGTAIHSGMFEPSRRRQGALYQNVYAVVVLSVSISVALGVLAKVISIAFGQRAMSVADFVAISIIGAVISSLVVGGLTIGIALMSNSRGWDLDSVSAPLVTAAGDIVTIPSLYVGTFVVHIPWVTVAVTGVAAALAIGVVTRGLMTDLPLARRAIRESIPVLAIAGTVDILAGLVVEKRLDKFVAFPVLFVLIPPFLEDAGSLGGILSSRLASKLHLGALSPRRWPESPALLDFSLIFLFAISVFALVGTSANLVGTVFHQASPGFLKVVGVSMLAGFISTIFAVIVAYYTAIATFRFGLDPDNHGIPLITSSMDLIGVIALVIALVVFRLA
jgi:mgtE-like transporter